jgi:ABC-type multidrug transport system ATPase subunit
MQNGRLLAFETPRRLKADYLHGSAWALSVSPLLEAVELMSTLPGIAQATLHGDQAQVIASGTWSPASLTTKLTEQGITVAGIETVEPTLEDVFVLLAHQ